MQWLNDCPRGCHRTCQAPSFSLLQSLHMTNSFYSWPEIHDHIAKRKLKSAVKENCNINSFKTRRNTTMLLVGVGDVILGGED